MIDLGIRINEEAMNRFLEIKKENPNVPKRGFKKWYLFIKNRKQK